MLYKYKNDIEIVAQDDFYILRDHDTDIYIKMYEKEYRVLQKFKEITTKCNLSEYEEKVFNKFLSLGIIVDENNSKKQNYKRKLNLFNLDIKEFNVENLLLKIQFLNKIIFSKAFKIILSIFAILSIVSIFYISNNQINILSLELYFVDLHELIIIYALIILSIWIHEIAHALTSLKYNIEVKKMGIKLYYFQPLVYCDLSNLYMSNNKRAKIKIYLAGIISQITISCITITGYTILLINNIRIDLLLIFAAMNFIVAIGNIIPFIKLDGYWILSTYLGIYNLEAKSLNTLNNIVKSKRGLRENIGFIMFALTNIAYKTFLIYSIGLLVYEIIV